MRGLAKSVQRTQTIPHRTMNSRPSALHYFQLDAVLEVTTYLEQYRSSHVRALKSKARSKAQSTKHSTNLFHTPSQYCHSSRSEVGYFTYIRTRTRIPATLQSRLTYRSPPKGFRDHKYLHTRFASTIFQMYHVQVIFLITAL